MFGAYEIEQASLDPVRWPQTTQQHERGELVSGPPSQCKPGSAVHMLQCAKSTL